MVKHSQRWIFWCHKSNATAAFDTRAFDALAFDALSLQTGLYCNRVTTTFKLLQRSQLCPLQLWEYSVLDSYIVLLLYTQSLHYTVQQMPPPWTYRDVTRGIFEEEWLKEYVKRNYEDRKGGLRDIREKAVIDFEKQFPRERRIIKGKLEDDKDMAERYEKQPSVRLSFSIYLYI